MIDKLVEILDECSLIYNLVYGFLSEKTPEIKSRKFDNSELTDFGYLCREMENLFDELRKECKARKELCGSLIAYELTRQALTDPTCIMQSRGTLAVGTPDVKMQVALPAKFTEEYFMLTDYFGIPREIAQTGILRLDWNAVTDYCTTLLREGKKVPFGFGKQYPLYQTTFKKLTKSKTMVNENKTQEVKIQEVDQMQESFENAQKIESSIYEKIENFLYEYED